VLRNFKSVRGLSNYKLWPLEDNLAQFVDRIVPKVHKIYNTLTFLGIKYFNGLSKNFNPRNLGNFKLSHIIIFSFINIVSCLNVLYN